MGTTPMMVETSDLAVFMPVEAVWPDLHSDEATLLDLLCGLSRDDTLFTCARVNTIVTGAGGSTSYQRQQSALRPFFSDDEIVKINTFARRTGVLRESQYFSAGSSWS